MGSDFVLRPRQDGGGSDLVIFGVIPTHTDPDPTSGLLAAGAVVLPEVGVPTDQKYEQTVRDDIATFCKVDALALRVGATLRGRTVRYRPVMVRVTSRPAMVPRQRIRTSTL